MVAFLRLRSSKRSSQNCENAGDYLENLKNPCFLDLQDWISLKTSLLSFGLKKITYAHISTYMNGAQNGAHVALRPKIPSKFNKNSNWTYFSQYKIDSLELRFELRFIHIQKVWNVSFHWKKKINAIAILEIFLSSCESTICKKMDFGASDLDF